MKTLTTLTVIVTFCLAMLPAGATTYLIISPPLGELSRPTAETVFKAYPELILRAQVDDEVLLYDGVNARLIASTTVGSGPDAVRLRKADASIRQALAVYRQADNDAASSPLNLPRVAREIIRPKLRAGEEVRVLIFGDPFDAIGDPAGDFDPGELPSDGFITQADTPWSAVGREDDLDQAVVSWVYLHDVGDNDEREAAFGFYAKWFSAQGATLTQVLPAMQGDDTMEALLGAEHQPWSDVLIDPSDTEVVIRVSVEPGQAERDPQEQAIIEARRAAIERGHAVIQRLDARGQLQEDEPVTFIFLIDASSSWWTYRPDVLASIDEGVGIVEQFSPWVRTAVIPFRQTALDRFELQTIRADRPGRRDLTDFLTGIGSESAKVDLETLCVSTLAELGRTQREGRVCWCLLTDTDVYEWDADDSRAQQRIERAAQEWSAQGDRNFVMTVYVGDAPGGDEAQHMREIAEAAGRRGLYTASREDLIADLLNAALKE